MFKTTGARIYVYDDDRLWSTAAAEAVDDEAKNRDGFISVCARVYTSARTYTISSRASPPVAHAHARLITTKIVR